MLTQMPDTKTRATPQMPAFMLRDVQAQAPVGILRSLGKDEEIFGEGDEAAWHFKVVSGVVRTCKILQDGRRQIDAFHVAGEIFGIERGTSYRSSAEAVGPVTVAALRRCSLEALATAETVLARQVVATALLNLE